MFRLGNIAYSIGTATRRMRGRGRSGSAIIEFAMVAPIFFLFLFGTIETGVIFFVESTLTNATNDAARMVRTGQIQGDVTADEMRDQVCTEMTGLMSTVTCKNTLLVDMRVFNGFTGASYPNVINPDGSLNTGDLKVEDPDACSVVLFRAFYPWQIMTPLMAPLMANAPGGEYLLTAAAAFRNEPYPSSTYATTTSC